MKHREETVRVANLETGYHSKKKTAVVTRDISASLYSGELTCLLGPNGAGKSTLLRTLAAFLPPVKGEIFIRNKPLEEYSDADLSKVIGVVLTEKPDIDNMSVEELVGMGRSPYTGFWGRMDEDDRRIVAESMALVGIDSLRGRMMQTLSDGERQKVMIAKTLAQETPVIFLDEPTAFLDYPSKIEVMQLLQCLARNRGKTVFLSTHDLELALQIADKVWLLDKPHGVTVGTPEDLSVNGDMGRYFHREGIVFDSESGLFRISHRTDRTVRLIGEGMRFNMVRKALARQGLDVCDTAPSDIVIEVVDDGYMLNCKRAHTIGMLLDMLDESL